MIKNPLKKIKKIPNKKGSPKDSPKKEIPKDLLEHFVGHVENLWMIRAGHLWEDKYRINVWTEEWIDGWVTPKHEIVKSFFVQYHEAEQMILDKTIAPKPKKEKIF